MPEEIELIYTTYNAAFIIPKEGEWIICYHHGEFNSYSTFDFVLKNMDKSNSISIPISGNSKFAGEWTKGEKKLFFISFYLFLFIFIYF